MNPSTRVRTAALLFVSSTLAACAAVLGLPDPTLDELAAPGDPNVDPEAGADGPVDDASMPDASRDATAGDVDVDGGCDPTGSWGNIVRLDALATDTDDDMPSLTEDEQTIYFRRGTADGLGSNILLARRADAGPSFAPPSSVPTGSSPDGVLAPCVTPDGGRLYYSRFQGNRIMLVSMSLPSGAEALEQGLQGAMLSFCGSLASDRSMTFWTQPGPTDPRTYLRAPVYSNILDKPEPVPGFVPLPATLGVRPVVSRDQRTIFYQGTPGGTNVPHIYRANRTSTSLPFTNHKLVADLKSTAADAPGWLSADGCRLYFSSSRPGTKGGQDIYMATQGGAPTPPPPPTP